METKVAYDAAPPYNPGYAAQPAYAPQAVAPAQTVVVQQPTSVTTTVITQQVQAMNEWGSGTCDCFNDIKSCCCAFFLGNCYYACVATRMGENCCVGLCGYPEGGCVPGGHLAMRSRFRGTHNIRGDICSDCCMTHFCLPCAMCQLSREMDRLGYPAGSC